MSETTLKNMVRKFLLNAEGSCALALQGGEPTLWGLENFRKLIDYVNHYNRKNITIHYSLQTNGYHITPEWCQFLHDNHFLVGLSLDGTKEIHDRYRHGRDGNGSYDRVLSTIHLFDEYQVDYNILTVVHKDVAHNIKEIYQDYKSRGWKYLQFINCLDPLGEVRGQKEYSLLPEDYGQFLIDLFELWYEDLKRGEQPFIRQFENFIQILLGYLPESCEQRGTCGIQNVVEADGSVYPCDFYVLDDYYLGNINTDKVASIYARREELGFVERSKSHQPSCSSCPWYRLCKGGCYRSREGEDTNYFCSAYQMFFAKHYQDLVDIADTIRRGHV